MIRPTNFGTNEETFEDNKFMNKVNESPQAKSLLEFNNYVEKLNTNGIETIIYDQPHVDAVDAIFPNNWFSTHTGENFPTDGLLVLYPMKSKLRRLERSETIIADLQKQYKNTLDLRYLEENNHILESTGSLIFDDENRLIFCGLYIYIYYFINS